MKLRELLKPESVILSLPGGSKEEIIRSLVDVLPVDGGEAAKDDVLRAVLEREEVMSTGIGRGVAIPHAKCDRVQGVVAAIGIAAKPVPFEAIDGKPVKVFFLIVSDSRTASPHVKALSLISRVLNDEARKEALESATTVDEIFDALDVAEQAA